MTAIGLDSGHRFVSAMSRTLGAEWRGERVGWSG